MKFPSFRIVPHLASFGLYTLSLGLGGCIDDDRDDATDTAASTDADPGTTGATTGTGGSGSASATTTAGITTSTDTATAGTAAGTSGDADSVAESCEVACMNLVGCFPDSYASLAECVAFCIEDTTPEPDPACRAATVAFNECLGGVSCRDLKSMEIEVCEDEFVALEGACGGTEEPCAISAGGDVESCGISETCPDSSRALECEGELCRCLEDGIEVATCSNDVCEDEIGDVALSQKALACCGWELGL